jgi:hypothetical protein
MMLRDLEKALGIIRQLVKVEPEKVAVGDAAEAFDLFIELEKVVVAGKVLFAGRATEAEEWRKKGHRNPAYWLAEKTGTGVSESYGLYETAERLESLPETIERYEQIRKNRSLVMWTDSEGVGRVEAKLTPDAMGRFMAAIESESNAIFRESRKSGLRESPMAYAADALVALVTGTNISETTTGTSSKAPRPTTLMHLRVDVAALRRGSLEGEEVCEIAGVGPVPLATAVNEIGNSILNVIVTDGVDVANVSHMGRAIPARIWTALHDRDEKCVVPGCDVAKGLENDHFHHQLKTHRGYTIIGGPGAWEWNAPESAMNPVLTS